MSIQEFEATQAAIPTAELIEKARAYIRDISKKGQREWRMTIPPSCYDTDMVFGEVCRRLEYLQRRCEAAEYCIERSPCDPDITSDQIEAHIKWEAIKNER